MPTSVTAPIYDGAPFTFQQFALRAARLMGACVLQRDESLDVPPRLCEPSRYYGERIAEITKRLAEVEAMTDAEFDLREAERGTKHVKDAIESNARRVEMLARYEAMKAAVDAWKPGKIEPEGLRALMLEQLKMSADGDCAEYHSVFRAATRQQALAGLRNELRAARDAHAAEVERCRKRNEWITNLYESLGLPVPSTK